MDLDSSDLELVTEDDVQTVGLRFRSVLVPPGATIVRSWVQFQVDETGGATTTLTIAGELNANPGAFTTATRNVSGRPRGTAVSWNPAPWTSVGAAGEAQRADVTVVIQQLVDRSGWASGNALVLIVRGSGKRVAESFDGSGGAPLLHVEYAP